MGTYTAGAPKQLGKFVATAGVPHKEIMIDHGALYASKGKATHSRRERFLSGSVMLRLHRQSLSARP